MNIFTNLTGQTERGTNLLPYCLECYSTSYDYATIAFKDANYVVKSLFRLSCTKHGKGNWVLEALFLIRYSGITITSLKCPKVTAETVKAAKMLKIEEAELWKAG